MEEDDCNDFSYYVIAMIKIIVFKGGLGNQMFQYAFYLRLRSRFPHSFYLFDIDRSQREHYGYELDKIFRINCEKPIKCYRLQQKCCPFIRRVFNLVDQKHYCQYDGVYLKGGYPFVKYNGYWQSEDYFKPIEQIVRETFVFQEELISKKTKEEAYLLDNSNSVAIHVRRGDYLNKLDLYGLCSKAYYDEAITHIRERVPNPNLVFFSDDINWVKEHINCAGATYVDWNTSIDSWQDMYLMSCCKHNIIANSSFSWWGAWLNTNKDKIVIAPEPWVNFSRDYDIVPKEWIRIKR